MAQMIEDRSATRDELQLARDRLAEAFVERDRARERYEAAVGTACELRAYMRLRDASRHVAASDKWLRWAESENPLAAPRPDHTPLDELVVA